MMTTKENKPLKENRHVTLLIKEVYNMPKNIEFNKRGFTVEETQTTIDHFQLSIKKNYLIKTFQKQAQVFCLLDFIGPWMPLDLF